MNVFFKATNLTISYGSNLVLPSTSFSLEKGKIHGIIGPNGSGKSTLLKAILGLIPSQGEIEFFYSNQEQSIAYVPQRQEIDWNFPVTVSEVVGMAFLSPKKWWKRISKLEKKAINEALKLVGLEEKANSRIGELSGGQQQRVFLARALAQNAEIILLDEPFAGIDQGSQEVILNVLLELKSKGKSLLIVHHDLSMVQTHFDEVLLLKNALIMQASAKEVFASSVLKDAFGFEN